jgi:CRISPR/Cas system CSM-associated protein Csm3 (group 7 of RAMP superfamily)
MKEVKGILKWKENGWFLAIGQEGKEYNLKDFLGLSSYQPEKEVVGVFIKGKLKKIIIDGKDFMPENVHEASSSLVVNNFVRSQYHVREDKRHNPHNFKYGKNYSAGDVEKYARSPYNFVPLNDEIICPPVLEHNSEKISGRIEFEIIAISDIFIRGKGDDFFSINGHVAIPGSSLRGLIRSLIEILSYSKMTFVSPNNNLIPKKIRPEARQKFFNGLPSAIVRDAINEEHFMKKSPDFCEELFGYIGEKSKSGRVFFEDSFVKKGDIEVLKEFKILLAPNTEAYRSYMESEGKRKPRIRGNKMYWHSTQLWVNTQKGKNNENILNSGRVVKKDSTFKGTIRFDDLTRIELGSLLFALNLPDGCAHKIGMGKSIGLGSISFQIKNLLQIDSYKRYNTLFSNSNWDDGINRLDVEHVVNLKKEFERFILGKLGFSQSGSLWSIDRIKELFHLLTLKPKEIDQTEWNGRVEYRSNQGNKILPKPSQVVDPETYLK